MTIQIMQRRLTALLLLMPLLAAAQTTNPDVTQDTIWWTICVSKWTKSVRPSTHYTNKLKAELVAAVDGNADDYELDHIIPLAVGGHPTDRKNLMLQRWDGPDGAHAKDIVEVRVKRLICVGRITLAQGQACLSQDWHACPRH